ncbi:pectin lyase-like protein [Colletotrichum falcatum]|nr:pectin lyase-like protein [Colletotrichum falcatum]
MRLFSRIVCLAALLFHSNLHVTAQFSQDYQLVVDLTPESLFLVYNCYYMKDICYNAVNFFQSSRGRNLHPNSQIPSGQLGYDFNTGKGSTTHSSQRRDQSCPGSWKNNHLCPEYNQRPVMRHDGAWYTTDLEPGTTINEIKALPGINGGPGIRSKVRYSCEEFPAATWVEGGSGIDFANPAFTRCVGFNCRPGTKSEQFWQGQAHKMLRIVLKKRIKRRQDDLGQFPWFDSKANEGVVFFHIRFDSRIDNVAARVMSYQDPDLSCITLDQPIKQGFRRSEQHNTSSSRPELFTVDDLLAHVEAGRATQITLFANDSTLAWSDMDDTGMVMPSFSGESRWNADEDDDGNELTGFSAQQTRYEPEKKSGANQPTTTRRASNSRITPILKRAGSQDIVRARRIVQDAIAESSKLNAARLAKPRRNTYGWKSQGTATAGRFSVGNSTASSPPLLLITDEIADAAALVAEADASGQAGNLTRRAATSGTFWMGNIARKGTVPWGDGPEYKAFRNVLDYGAMGDGVTDDTKAIKLAMMDGKRCGKKCNGSTTKNAIVYFPPGTYLISTTIPLPYGTQVIGDANDRPRLKAALRFVGLGVLSTDEYTGEGGTGIDGGDPQYYVNTANFYRQIRNVIIDVSGTGNDRDTACLHYQVAQATSLQNVELVAAPGSKQIGIYAENGSGGGISDVVFKGGAVGIYGGNQQFTAQRLSFDGCTIGVQSITMQNVDVGFKLISDDGSGNIRSVSIMDSTFSNVGTAAIVIGKPSSQPGSGSTGVVLDRVSLSGVAAAVKDSSGNVLLPGSAGTIDQWTLGPVYEGSTTARSFSAGGRIGSYRRPSTLVDTDGKYFERERPQYERYGLSDFVHVKDLGAMGDGVTDDTAAFQAALYSSQGKVLFVDAGSYILTSTVTVPLGTKIVGETWSQLVASGSYFSDASNPKVMLKVGNPGEVGNIEMQDLIFTSRGPTAGLVLVEWNIEATSPGSAGFWDCHVRIGGATGTSLTPTECPPVTSGTNQGCNAASLMFHLTPSGSGCFENMWLWVADHMIDDPDLNDSRNPMVQTSIYTARGFLIESTKPTWLYATASEHAVFYQYNFHKAKNIFAGMLQTESPYYQPTPPPPAPFAAVVGDFQGDPDYTCATNDFGGCDQSWAVIVRESENVFVAGAGICSWFSTYSQSCIDTQECQKALVLLDSNRASVRFQNLVTIGAKYMAVMDGQGIPAMDNLNVKSHPSWSQISILDVSSTGSQFNDLVWLDPAIWKMEQPQFTCVPPCHVKIPPWTGATSTVNYPLITVSAGAWTSTITKPPVAVSQWVFKPVTLTQGATNGKFKRQNPAAFWPVPALTPSWPAVIYTGPDGSATTTAPTIAFPTPPASIGPDAVAPLSGSWPKRDIQPYFGQNDQPWVQECGYFDFDCFSDSKPWLYGDNSIGSDDDTSPDDDYDENWREALVICPESTSTSTSSRVASKTTTIPTPEPSPKEEGNPRDNKHLRMDYAANSFCNGLRTAGEVQTAPFMRSADFELDYNGGVGSIVITIRFEITHNCQWKWDYNECRHYLTVPVDSCNCASVDHKQGGTVRNGCYSWTIDPNIHH